MCNSWEGNHRVLSYIQDSFFLSEKRGPADGRLTWCCSQGGQVAWEQTPLEEGTTWLCKEDQFASNSGSPKNPASWWWVFLRIKACLWVAGYLTRPYRNYLFKKMQTPSQICPHTELNFLGEGKKRSYFSHQSLCVGKAIRCCLFLAL